MDRTVSLNDWLYVRDAINDRGIIRVQPDSKELPSIHPGQFYTWQFYLRSVLYDPKALSIITEDFFNRNPIEELNRLQLRLAGIESSSVSMMIAFQQEANRRGRSLDIISVRKEAKAYGLQQWVEGRVDYRYVMMVDDLIADNHKWNLHTYNILIKSGIRPVNKMYGVVFKGFEHPVTKYDGVEVILENMFDLNDFDLNLKTFNEER